jgi:2,3-bisphosphoglycerate-dependent phosphoglycerate mutase
LPRVSVGLRVRSNVWLVGTSDFFHAFFSTISARLEPDGWGTRFPALMNELYAGELPAEHAPAALAELDQIREELRRLPPSDVVWDVEDRGKQPPWGEDISDEITDLGNYFVTEDGKDLIDVMAEAIAYAARAGAAVRVQQI